MLGDGYQIVDVLMLVGNVAPIGLYFLALGLVNSHSRPYMTTSRSDFLGLTTVLIPLFLWPLPSLVGSRLWWGLGLALAAACGVFIHLLPRAGTGFVIYNISEASCIRLLENTLSRLGLTGAWIGRVWRSDCGRLSIHLRKFALLRNVSLNVETKDAAGARLSTEIGDAMHARLQYFSQLPSTMGACLVMLGAGLLILPMWMVSRHIQDFVEAVSHLLG